MLISICVLVVGRSRWSLFIMADGSEIELGVRNVVERKEILQHSGSINHLNWEKEIQRILNLSNKKHLYSSDSWETVSREIAEEIVADILLKGFGVLPINGGKE
jgi:hypothetical protein